MSDNAPMLDRAEVVRLIRERLDRALADAERGIAQASEFVSVGGRMKVTDAEREVALALNVSLELIGNERDAADGDRWIGLHEAVVALVAELTERDLPIVAPSASR